MKKIVPFKKEIIFKTNLFEITSISLENTLKIEDLVVSGNFIVSGEYKITEQSVDVETFSYSLPFSIAFDPKYILDNSTVDINDFYYEIINDRVLSVNIEVLIDNIDEKESEEDIMEEVIEEQRCVEEENNKEEEIISNDESTSDNNENKESINIFNNINIEDSYNTYKVYIVRENDTLESIINKYNISKEELDEYNDLSEIKIGDKIVIPISNERD